MLMAVAGDMEEEEEEEDEQYWVVQDQQFAQMDAADDAHKNDDDEEEEVVEEMVIDDEEMQLVEVMPSIQKQQARYAQAVFHYCYPDCPPNSVFTVWMHKVKCCTLFCLCVACFTKHRT